MPFIGGRCFPTHCSCPFLRPHDHANADRRILPPPTSIGASTPGINNNWPAYDLQPRLRQNTRLCWLGFSRDEKMSSTSQSRLKRRIHGSSAVSSPQSRPGTTFSSDDFDLPPPETHPEPPKKRARKKGLPAASKKKQPQGEGDDKDAITTHDTQPRVSSIKELPIPTVNEMALRKPSIVHFGPGGPENQAVLPSLKKPVGVLEDARADDDIPAASPSMNNTASMPPPAAKAFPDGPVRVKKSLLDAISTEPTEPEHPPATPASFCTRLEAENISIPGIQTTPDQAREPSIHDTTYASGNASITLIDDDSTFPRQQTFSPSRRRRQQRSISTDLRSTEDSPSFRRRSKVMVDNHKLPSPGIRESQQGLMDSMSQITKVSS